MKFFSEFEIKESSIRFLDEQTPAERIGCVGKLETTMDTKTISKKCEGVEVKNVVKGTGTGTGKITLHMALESYRKSYGMISDDYKDGVYSYGNKSRHKPFCFTAKVYDEEDNTKLVAYPNIVVTSGKSRTIENGAEEVAEIELEVKIMPDEYGQGEYEALTSEMDETIINSWLTNFNSELVKLISEEG